jgi:hypothetical protein
MKDRNAGAKSKKSNPEDAIIKKIKQLYSNYGIDISDMSDDEFSRIKDQYLEKKVGALDDDLKASEKYIPDFAEKII